MIIYKCDICGAEHRSPDSRYPANWDHFTGKLKCESCATKIKSIQKEELQLYETRVKQRIEELIIPM